MTSLYRRVASVVLASAMVVSLGAEMAFAQGATVGPAGGIPSSSAPSNSQGTPAGGTGVIGGTRVGPGSTAAMPSGGMTTASPGSTMGTGTDEVAPTRRRRVRRVRHHRRRHSTAARRLGNQSESGLNGSENTVPR